MVADCERLTWAGRVTKVAGMKRLGGLVLLVVALSVGVVQAQERPAITGIAFVRMYSADMTASEAFYGKTLGLKRVADAQGIARYGVNEAQWVEVTALPTPAPVPETRVAEVAFATRDVKGMRAYLKAHGVAIVEEQGKNGFAVHDPEGNLIGFVQRASIGKGISMSPVASSRRVIHAGFAVRDAAAEDAFYHDLLGFHPYWHGGMAPDKTDWVSLQVPEGSDWLEYMLNMKPDASAKQRGVLNHFSLGVAQMSDAVTALAKNGCTGPNCSKTQMGRDGKVQLNLFDPDLTRVEFMEFKTSGTICCSEIKGRTPVEIEDK